MAHSKRKSDDNPPSIESAGGKKRRKRRADHNNEAARQRKLDAINTKLDGHGLPPFERLGDIREGEDQLDHVISITESVSYTIVIFSVIWSRGEPGEWLMRYNRDSELVMVNGKPMAISGAHCVVTLNRRWFVMVQQDHRTHDTFNARPIEVVRGFLPGNEISIAEAVMRRKPFVIGTDDPLVETPIRIAKKKLPKLMASGLVKIEEASFLGLGTGDSGIARVCTLITHLGLRTDDVDAVLRINQTRAREIRYLPIAETFANLCELGIYGDQCGASLLRFEHIVLKDWVRRGLHPRLW